MNVTLRDSGLQARGDVYASLAIALEYPSEDYVESLNSGTFADFLRASMERVYPGMGALQAWEELCWPTTLRDLRIEYTRLFDVGMAGPPCPLNGGVYSRSRMGCLQDLVRFYNHFDLSVEQHTHDRKLPDHATVQLEFMHFLASCESQFTLNGHEAGLAYTRAQRDFLDKHLCQWLPALLERLRQQRPLPIYLALLELLLAFIERDLAALHARAGKITVMQVS